jgi:hypothetical protein
MAMRCILMNPASFVISLMLAVLSWIVSRPSLVAVSSPVTLWRRLL